MTYCWWTNSVQYLNPLNYNVDNLDTKVLHKRLSPLYLSLYLINLPRALPESDNRFWTPIQTIRKHQHFQKHFQQTQHVRKIWRKNNLDVFYILFRSQKGSLYSRTWSAVDYHIFLLLLRGIRLGISTYEKQWFKTTWAEIFSDHLFHSCTIIWTIFTYRIVFIWLRQIINPKEMIKRSNAIITLMYK